MFEMSLVRASLLGGVDGVITSFAIVAGATAGDLGVDAVWIMGVSSVMADGFSMGISEYLSSSSARAKGEELASGGRSTTPPLLGLACFTAFVACGIVPIVLYAATNGRLLAVAMFSLVELMLLGASRACVASEPLLWGLVQTTVLGACAGGVAYGVGAAVYAATR